MRRYEVKSGRVEESWERTSLLKKIYSISTFEFDNLDGGNRKVGSALLDLEEGILLVR